jgi:predicted RNase H-like HicB family nuclease
MNSKPAHRYDIRIYWSDPDDAFLAEVPDVPYLVAQGDSPALAAAALDEMIVSWLDVARQEGWPIPEPTKRQVA